MILIAILFVASCFNLEIAIGTDLNSSYNESVILTRAQSPYYVQSDIFIKSNVTIDIENGVDIIFNGDYTINNHGFINACYDIDTSISNNHGLYNSNDKTHIFSFQPSQQLGTINFNSEGYGSFCNVLFESMDIF